MIRAIAIGLLSFALTSCATQVVDTSCSLFGPITYSAVGDTVETVTQVRQHNAAWHRICR